MQQMTISIRWTVAAILAFVFTGCGGGTDEPRATVDDPRSYAIAALQTMDLNTWWQAYRNPDPLLLGQIVDDVAAREPDGLPSDARRLDTFIRNRIAPSYKLHMDDTEEGKAYILAQAEARFADPPMVLWDKNGAYALLDYHILPGEWQSTTRLSEGLAHPPAIGERPFLKTDVLVDSLKRLVDAYPDARNYQIRYQYHQGSDLKKILMEFARDTQLVYQENGSIQFTADPIAWDDLRNGRVDLAALDWNGPIQDDPGPSITLPPDEPLPSRP